MPNKREQEIAELTARYEERVRKLRFAIRFFHQFNGNDDLNHSLRDVESTLRSNLNGAEEEMRVYRESNNIRYLKKAIEHTSSRYRREAVDDPIAYTRTELMGSIGSQQEGINAEEANLRALIQKRDRTVSFFRRFEAGEFSNPPELPEVHPGETELPIRHNTARKTSTMQLAEEVLGMVQETPSAPAATAPQGPRWKLDVSEESVDQDEDENQDDDSEDEEKQE